MNNFILSKEDRMKYAKSIPEFFDALTKHNAELEQLRAILLSAHLVETLKWGIPVYTYNGENIVGIGSFKSYFGLWFYQGVFLKDPLKKLISAQEGTTKALRQWRFESASEIVETEILGYVLEAIENQKAGKKMKPLKKVVTIPEELQTAMNADPIFKQKFETLSQGKRNDYAEHIGAAKRAETRNTRLEKSIPLILKGAGLHDKYKK